MMTCLYTRGYTLVELLVTIAVLMVVAGAVSQMIVSMYDTHEFTLEQAYAIQDARANAERVVQELREATIASDGTYPVESIDPLGIVFYADVEGDARVERLRYQVQNGAWLRGVTTATGTPLGYNPSQDEVVATTTEYVRNDTLGTDVFTFYDTNGAQITDMNSVLEVRFVEIALTVNINPTQAPTDFTIFSSTALRNLKDNL